MGLKYTSLCYESETQMTKLTFKDKTAVKHSHEVQKFCNDIILQPLEIFNQHHLPETRAAQHGQK